MVKLPFATTSKQRGTTVLERKVSSLMPTSHHTEGKGSLWGCGIERRMM